MRRPSPLAVALAVVLAAALEAANRFVAVPGGIQLFVQESGQGMPVVVLHGGPGLSLAYLAPDLQRLAERFRLVFYDQRGGGQSTVVSEAGKLTPDAFVSDLDRVRDSIRAGRVAILGHSWGAGLALLYASAHPTRVSRLLLVAPIPPRADPYLDQFSAALQSRLTDEDKAAVAAARERRRVATDEDLPDACHDYWRVFIKGYFSDPAAVARMRGDVCAVPAPALRNFGTVNATLMDGLGNFDWRPLLKSVRVPTLVIHGDRDPIPMEAAREWAAGLPAARLLVIANSGHFPFVEQPDLFFAASTEFLSGRWPASATRVQLLSPQPSGP